MREEVPPKSALRLEELLVPVQRRLWGYVRKSIRRSDRVSVRRGGGAGELISGRDGLQVVDIVIRMPRTQVRRSSPQLSCRLLSYRGRTGQRPEDRPLREAHPADWWHRPPAASPPAASQPAAAALAD